MTGSSATVILTIGHSTRPLAELVRLLQAHGVKCLVDVRTVPRSRHNPQFNRESLPASLRASGIGYTHLAELGGLRRPGPDSLNAAWRNPSFRGYADHMQTPQFAEGLRKLLAIAKEQQVAVMCAEAVPWRCHRSLLSDALLARGIAAEEIVSETRRQPHRMTEWARVDGTHVTYPQPLLPLLQKL